MSWIAVGMAAAGLIKSQTIDKDKEKRQRNLAAQTQALSPWTNMEAGPIQEADALGSTMQFGMAGMGMKQNMADHKAQQGLLKAQTDAVNGGAPQQQQQILSGEQMKAPAQLDVKRASIYEANDPRQQQPARSPWLYMPV